MPDAPASPQPEPPPAAAPESGTREVILVGNYPPDVQESMQRFADVLQAGLLRLGVQARTVTPSVVFGRFAASSLHGPGKWLGYVDKFLLFPRRLRRLLRDVKARSPGKKIIVHICDHANAMYAKAARGFPIVTTCHDLLAVRSALGEDTDFQMSFAGKRLQRWILSSLSRAGIIACVSSATKEDAERMLPPGTRTRLVHNGLNQPYHVIPQAEAERRLTAVCGLGERFVLVVGSNLRRKNREGALRIFSRTASRWDGQLVISGQPLTDSLRELARSLGISGRVIEVPKPDNATLEALYNRATALLFPSRFEGFGWPIIEAQACGCPVVCSNTGPMPEVAGDAGLLRDVNDEAGFADDIILLTDAEERARRARTGLANVGRFTAEQMVLEYLRVYGEASASL